MCVREREREREREEREGGRKKKKDRKKPGIGRLLSARFAILMPTLQMTIFVALLSLCSN